MIPNIHIIDDELTAHLDTDLSSQFMGLMINLKKGRKNHSHCQP